MPKVQVRVKQGPVADVVFDRIPVEGDYITPNGHDLIRVRAVVLTPTHATLAAVALAENDPDDTPDEIKDLDLGALG